MSDVCQAVLNRFRLCPACGAEPSVVKYDDGEYECKCVHCDMVSTGKGPFGEILDYWNQTDGGFTPEDEKVENYYIELFRKELRRHKFSEIHTPLTCILTTTYSDCRQTLEIDLQPQG